MSAKPMLVCCSDTHIRDTIPEMYGDNELWLSAQFDQLKFIVDTSKRLRVPLVIAGDLFHTHNISFEYVWKTFKVLSGIDVCFVYGQHDLYGNTVESANDSPAYPIRSRKSVLDDVVERYDFGVPRIPLERQKPIALTHELIYKDAPFEGAPVSGYVKNAAKKYSGYSLVISGDNHEGFTYEHDGIRFINCGAINRQKRDKVDYIPKCFIVYDDYSCSPVDIPQTEIESVAKGKATQVTRAFAKSLVDYTKPLISFEKRLRECLLNEQTDAILSMTVENLLERAINGCSEAVGEGGNPRKRSPKK